MAVPKFTEMFNPFLAAIADGKVHQMKDVSAAVGQAMNLSEEDLARKRSQTNTPLLHYLLGWTRTYLKKAGLVDTPQRSHVVITQSGKDLLNSGILITESYLLQNYPSFAEFKNVAPHSSDNPVQITLTTEESSETPQESLERAYALINDQLADDLLTEVLRQSPAFFEQLVVDLMKAMNYGEGFVTKYSGDDGIDGIIHEDRLGFNLIYIQAKRWKPDITIGKPELQKFAGAMMGPPKVEKGLFITTAKFSPKAQEFANAQHIILVDGKRLTDLMIEYGVGVSTQKTYFIKRVDSDYFSGE